MGVVKKVLSTKFIVSMSTLLVLLVRRFHAEVVFFIVGALLNALWSKLLKRVMNRERPDAAKEVGMSDPGMPSSHAQTLFYYASCLVLEFTHPAKVREWTRSPTVALALMVGFCTFAVGSSLWRAHKGYHTYAQVAVGAGVGVCFGVVYYRILFRLMEYEYARYVAPLPLAVKAAMLVVLLVAVTVVLDRSLQHRIKRIKKKIDRKLRRTPSSIALWEEAQRRKRAGEVTTNGHDKQL